MLRFYRSGILSLYRYNNNYRNWGRIAIRCWIHKRHPIPRPYGRAMWCLAWIILRKLTRVVTARHCISKNYHDKGSCITTCSANYMCSVWLNRKPSKLISRLKSQRHALTLRRLDKFVPMKYLRSIIGMFQLPKFWKHWYALIERHPWITISQS